MSGVDESSRSPLIVNTLVSPVVRAAGLTISVYETISGNPDSLVELGKDFISGYDSFAGLSIYTIGVVSQQVTDRSIVKSYKGPPKENSKLWKGLVKSMEMLAYPLEYAGKVGGVFMAASGLVEDDNLRIIGGGLSYYAGGLLQTLRKLAHREHELAKDSTFELVRPQHLHHLSKRRED